MFRVANFLGQTLSSAGQSMQATAPEHGNMMLRLPVGNKRWLRCSAFGVLLWVHHQRSGGPGTMPLPAAH